MSRIVFHGDGLQMEVISLFGLRGGAAQLGLLGKQGSSPAQPAINAQPNRAYTAKSAYNIQFVGSYSTFNGPSIWKAEAEGKHKFFALLVQSKILMPEIAHVTQSVFSAIKNKKRRHI